MELEFLRQEAKRQKEELVESERDRKRLKSSGSVALGRSSSDIILKHALIHQLPEEVMLNIFG